MTAVSAATRQNIGLGAVVKDAAGPRETPANGLRQKHHASSLQTDALHLLSGAHALGVSFVLIHLVQVLTIVPTSVLVRRFNPIADLTSADDHVLLAAGPADAPRSSKLRPAAAEFPGPAMLGGLSKVRQGRSKESANPRCRNRLSARGPDLQIHPTQGITAGVAEVAEPLGMQRRTRKVDGAALRTLRALR
jgi:hypothetical protein